MATKKPNPDPKPNKPTPKHGKASKPTTAPTTGNDRRAAPDLPTPPPRPRAGIGGRPTKLTAKIIKEADGHLRMGAHIETVSALLGISAQTWRTWFLAGARAKRLAEESGQPVPPAHRLAVQFLETVRVARAYAEQQALARIRAAASGGQWKADAWWLERSHPGRYGRALALTGEGGGAVKVEATSVVDVMRKVWAKPDTKAADPDDGLVDPAELPGDDE